MQNKRTISVIVLVVGIIILALSVLADPIGVGGSAGFGTRQILGTVVGAIVTIAGLVLMRRQ